MLNRFFVEVMVCVMFVVDSVELSVDDRWVDVVFIVVYIFGVVRCSVVSLVVIDSGFLDSVFVW